MQGFFAQLFRHDSLGRVVKERGKFRSFLPASLNLFLSDANDRDRAAKRGGGAPAIALDAFDAEERYCFDPSMQWTRGSFSSGVGL